VRLIVCTLQGATLTLDPPLLPSHVLGEQIRLGAAATGDLTLLLNAIQLTSKFIATNVRRARLINLLAHPLPPAVSLI
jgi:hypothetical protein